MNRTFLFAFFPLVSLAIFVGAIANAYFAKDQALLATNQKECSPIKNVKPTVTARSVLDIPTPPAIQPNRSSAIKEIIANSVKIHGRDFELRKIGGYASLYKGSIYAVVSDPHESWFIAKIDANTGETTRLTNEPKYEIDVVKASDDYVVWIDQSDNQRNIVALDQKTGCETLVTKSYGSFPELFKNSVLWTEFDGSVWHVYKHDLKTGKTEDVYHSAEVLGYPRFCDDNNIVFVGQVPTRKGVGNLIHYDVLKQTTRVLGSVYFAASSQDGTRHACNPYGAAWYENEQPVISVMGFLDKNKQTLDTGFLQSGTVDLRGDVLLLNESKFRLDGSKQISKITKQTKSDERISLFEREWREDNLRVNLFDFREVSPQEGYRIKATQVNE